jgi:hypothetical protein
MTEVPVSNDLHQPAAPNTREAVMRSIPIGKGDFVVEVGGGHRPFPRSDLIIDKYPFEQAHRTADMAHTAPVIIADAVKMPLPDKGCDLLFASHIIEHLPHPDEFVAEIKRCSHRVYLEFPSRRRELMCAWSFHEWLVEAHETHLIFYKNDIPQLFGDFFHRNYDHVLDAWCLQRHWVLNTYVYCDSNRLSCEIAQQTAFERAVSLSATGSAKVNFADPVSVPYTWRQVATIVAMKLLPKAILGWLRKVRRHHAAGALRPLPQQLLSRLICPQCRGRDLRLVSAEILCPQCHTIFRQRNGIFDFDVYEPCAALHAKELAGS